MTVRHRHDCAMRHAALLVLLCCTITVLLSCTAPSYLASATTRAQRIDNIPMYGQPGIPRPDHLKKADEDFIKEVVAGLGNREAASKLWYVQAEKYMEAGNLDFAMRRYNQSWLLNPKNYQPYWGFGRVLVERGQLLDAIQHLEKAKDLVDDPYQRVALLVDLGTAYSLRAESVITMDAAESKRIFTRANQLYSDAMSSDPAFGYGWQRWAMSLYREGDYAQAWEKVRQSRTSSAPPLPPGFLRALEQKMPEPRQQTP